MREFEKELFALSRGDMELLAGELLGRLGAGTQAQAEQAQREFINAEKDGAAAFEFAEGYAQQALPEFIETQMPEYPDRQFLTGEKQAHPKRGFAEGYAHEAAKAEFPDMAAAAAVERDFLGEQDKSRAGYDIKGRGFFAGSAADRAGNMEEISDFFRRDGRRYDSGFRQY